MSYTHFTSGELLVGRIKKEGLGAISHKKLYSIIYRNSEERGEYKKYLRQKKKQRRRKGSSAPFAKGKHFKTANLEERQRVIDV